MVHDNTLLKWLDNSNDLHFDFTNKDQKVSKDEVSSPTKKNSGYPIDNINPNLSDDNIKDMVDNIINVRID